MLHGPPASGCPAAFSDPVPGGALSASSGPEGNVRSDAFFHPAHTGCSGSPLHRTAAGPCLSLFYCLRVFAQTGRLSPRLHHTAPALWPPLLPLFLPASLPGAYFQPFLSTSYRAITHSLKTRPRSSKSLNIPSWHRPGLKAHSLRNQHKQRRPAPPPEDPPHT